MEKGMPKEVSGKAFFADLVYAVDRSYFVSNSTSSMA